MGNFIMREVSNSYKGFEGTNIEAIRTRTSNGYAGITVKINGLVALSFNTDAHGDDYELIASAVARLLDEIASEPCLLPKHDEG